MEQGRVTLVELKERTQKIFEDAKSVYCPYFKERVILNSDGLHHLQFSARHERNQTEQRLKFSLVPLGLEVIVKSGTIQEYRKELVAIGKKDQHGYKKMKLAEYWGLVAIVKNCSLKIRVVLRRVGDGNIAFWSIMPYGQLGNGKKQRLASVDLTDDILP